VSAAGLFLIGVPLAFNTAFAGLAARFDYPDVLRQPTRVDALLARVRRPQRRLEARRAAHAAGLRRLVAVADGDRVVLL
jgi:hypothetical protein